MFPISITLNVTNAEQLLAVTNAVSGKSSVGTAETKTSAKADTAKKPDAVTAPADTQSTAAATGAQESKATNSAPPDIKYEILGKDALTAAVKNAIAKSGRDPVVALIQSYGAAKAGDVPEEKRREFDAKLLGLAV